MRRLNQHVARIGKRKQMTRAKTRDEIEGHVSVRTGDQPQRDSFLVENGLQISGSLPDGGARIMIQTGQNVRGAGHYCHALRDGGPRHLQRHRQVASAVVDSRQYVAMKVDHRGTRIVASASSNMTVAQGNRI